ncbi:hypothetical protein [Aliivibrio salmonicida]|uniref:hypothetical protein n=1 Tax=Aliivibrio salmonicida TaxID=40269 RepID=UPI0005C865B3
MVIIIFVFNVSFFHQKHFGLDTTNFWKQKMTMNDFKHSDFYHILKVAKELGMSISQFVINSCLNIGKGLVWTSKKTYRYVMR